MKHLYAFNIHGLTFACLLLAQTLATTQTQVKIQINEMIGPQILYLEQEGVGIIDSMLTGEDNRFSLPKSELPLFSVSVKKQPEVRKSFLAEPGSPVILVHIDSLSNHRIFIDAGLRDNILTQALAEFDLMQHELHNRLKNAPLYKDEIETLDHAYGMAIFNTLDYYFKLDEPVAITLLSKYMRRLHILHLPYDILEQLKTNVLSLPRRLQNHPVVKEINHYLDPLLHATIGFPTMDLTSIPGVIEPFSLQNYLSRFVILYIYPPSEGNREQHKDDWSPKFVDFLKDHVIHSICIDLRIDNLDKKLDDRFDQTFYVRDIEDQNIFKRFYDLTDRSKVILISPLGNILADDIDDPAEIMKVVSEYWNGMNF